MNKVSCLTITKNRVSFLRRCIEYYLKQTYSDKGLVIIGFDDDVDTYNFINGISKEEIDLEKENIKYFQIDSDTILGEARNIGIQKTAGDWICIWDDDDYFTPNRIEEQLKYCKEYKVQATLLSCLLLFSEKHQEGRITFERKTGWEGSLFIRKSQMMEYDILDKGEDTPLIQRLFKNINIRVMFNPDLYIYYLHNSNTSGERHLQQIYDHSLPLKNEKNREIKKLIGWI